MAVFTCSSCQYEMPTADSHIGRNAKCPKCDKHGRITPDPPEKREANPPKTPIPESKVNIRTTPESQNSLRRTSNANRSQIDQNLPVWAALIIAMAFGVLGLLTTAGAVLFVFSLSSATGAPQEAAAGAIFSALFIAGYIITRSIEKVVRSIARR